MELFLSWPSSLASMPWLINSTTRQWTLRGQDETGAVLHWVYDIDKTTAIVFAVNQLCPSSIGIYPLVIIHPKPLPRQQVRSINLIMTGSPGFGSNWMDFQCVHLALHLTQSIYLLTHYAIGNWSPEKGLSTVGLSVSGSVSLPLGFLIQLSLSVLSTIAIQFYSALAFAHNLLSNQPVKFIARQVLAFILSLFTTQRVLYWITYQLLRYLSSLANLLRLSPKEWVNAKMA